VILDITQCIVVCILYIIAFELVFYTY